MDAEIQLNLLDSGSSPGARTTAGSRTSTECKNESPSRSLRLVTYNVQCGIGADKQYDPQRCAQWFASLDPQPDVIALQEVIKI